MIGGISVVCENRVTYGMEMKCSTHVRMQTAKRTSDRGVEGTTTRVSKWILRKQFSRT